MRIHFMTALEQSGVSIVVKTLIVLHLAIGLVSGITVGHKCTVNMRLYITKNNDCSTFYRCVFGKWREYSCPAGTVLNKVAKKCDWPEQYPQCNVSTTLRMTLTPMSSNVCTYPCPPDGSKFLFPDWSNCKKFYLCDKRRVYSGRCADVASGRFVYYNPLRYACEQVAEFDNVCVGFG